MTNPQEALQVIETLRTRNLADISLEELVTIYPKIKEYCTHVWDARRAVEGLIAERMESMKATTCSVNGTTLVLQVTKEREINPVLEMELLPLLTPDQVDRVVKYVPQFSWRGLKSLLSLGGRIRELIDQNVKELTTRVSIKVERTPLPVGATVQSIEAVSSNGQASRMVPSKSVSRNGA